MDYTWGCAKNYHKGLKISKKKGKDNFRNSVAASISREVLKTACLQKLAFATSFYIWAYKAVHGEANDNADFVIDS